MTAPIDPQIIMQGGKPAFAVIPWDEYQKLVRYSEADESNVWFPQQVVEANAVRGENLIKAWREYFGLTQQELARRAGMKQPALARLESSDTSPRTSTLKKLADAMNITFEQLID